MLISEAKTSRAVPDIRDRYFSLHRSCSVSLTFVFRVFKTRFYGSSVSCSRICGVCVALRIYLVQRSVRCAFTVAIIMCLVVVGDAMVDSLPSQNCIVAEMILFLCVVFPSSCWHRKAVYVAIGTILESPVASADLIPAFLWIASWKLRSKSLGL